ncbi:MAG: hypothetical protein LBH96_05285 [Candidatus Peribacteria bacterium]|nr:hypothetical protein [Candidatus Peribacteria bacterium]
MAFNKLDIAVGNHFTEKRENITIGEYFSYIMDVFPNPAFKRYISTLSDEQLALPLCNLVSLP